jgi:predicted secreted protein
MRWTSILAIYFLFWSLSLFVVLPFGVRNHHESGVALTPGQADGAPTNFNPRRIVIATTLLAAVAFALYYANYVEGWVGAEALNLFGRQPEAEG